MSSSVILLAGTVHFNEEFNTELVERNEAEADTLSFVLSKTVITDYVQTVIGVITVNLTY